MEEKGRQLVQAGASPLRALHIINNVIKPKIAHSMCVMPFAETDIERFDAALCRIAKACLSLHKSFPTKPLLFPTRFGGAGLGLMVDYIQVAAASLVRALNDSGDLGILTRGLLLQQLRAAGMLRVLRRGRSTALHSHPLPLLQLSLLRSAGIYLHTNASLDNTGPGEVFHLVGNDMWRELLARFGVDEAAFPPKVLRPLWSLGVASLSQITLPRGDRSYVASNTVLTDALGALVPRSELNAARLSLNRFTLLLNGVSPKVAAAYTHVTPVQPDAAREIRPPLASRSHVGGCTLLPPFLPPMHLSAPPRRPPTLCPLCRHPILLPQP